MVRRATIASFLLQEIVIHDLARAELSSRRGLGVLIRHSVPVLGEMAANTDVRTTVLANVNAEPLVLTWCLGFGRSLPVCYLGGEARSDPEPAMVERLRPLVNTLARSLGGLRLADGVDHCQHKALLGSTVGVIEATFDHACQEPGYLANTLNTYPVASIGCLAFRPVTTPGFDWSVEPVWSR
jgi:hypothetical protein